MAATPSVIAPQAGLLVTYNLPTKKLIASQGAAEVVFRQLAKTIDVDQAGAISGFRQPAVVNIQQAGAMALVRGRIANPRLRIWTFTLDDHDFVVLRLGDNDTLVFDATTQTWPEWDSAETGAWRPNDGITWDGGQAFGQTFGSSVVVGDDTFGLLWFLNPEQPWDQQPDSSRVPDALPFDRVVTGQVLATGRQALPCYAIFVDGDNYGLTSDTIVPSVLLEYSDDQGRTFISAGSVAQNDDLTAQNPYQWLSLGQVTSPGRIFRITDNGLFARIDSMEMNDDG